jgi:hypothetical protein
LFYTEGSVRQLILIGKSKTPKGTSKQMFGTNNITYYNQDKAWMDLALFEKWLIKLNRSLKEPIIILLDNFSGHDVKREFENIIIIFLPPNTTSRTQPLDAGIISAFKHRYRLKLMDYIITRAYSTNGEAPFSLKEITCARILPWLRSSLDEIKASSISKCFRKCLPDVQNLVDENNEDDEEGELAESLRRGMSKVADREVTVEEAHLFANMAEEEVLNEGSELESEKDTNVEEDHEAIRIATPARIEEHLLECIEYFQNTACYEEARALTNGLKKVREHLNFK